MEPGTAPVRPREIGGGNTQQALKSLRRHNVLSYSGGQGIAPGAKTVQDTTCLAIREGRGDRRVEIGSDPQIRVRRPPAPLTAGERHRCTSPWRGDLVVEAIAKCGLLKRSNRDPADGHPGERALRVCGFGGDRETERHHQDDERRQKKLPGTATARGGLFAASREDRHVCWYLPDRLVAQRIDRARRVPHSGRLPARR